MKTKNLFVVIAIALTISLMITMCSRSEQKPPPSTETTQDAAILKKEQTSVPFRLNVPFGDTKNNITFYGYDSCRTTLSNIEERSRQKMKTIIQDKNFAIDYYGNDKTIFIYHRNEGNEKFYLNILYLQNGEGEYIRKFEHHDLKIENKLITIKKDGKLVYYQQ